MSVNRFAMPVVIALTMVAFVLGARVTGDWIVSGRAVPMGAMTADDLKGWMTLENVADGLHIPMADLYVLAGIPAGSTIEPTTALKDLEPLLEGFEVSTLRDAAAAYLSGGGLPAAGTAVPVTSAVPVTNGVPVTSAVPVTNGVPVTSAVPVTNGVPVTTADHEPASVNGRMTLGEVADQAKVPLAQLLTALGVPEGTDAGTTVRELVDGGQADGIDAVRDSVEELTQVG